MSALECANMISALEDDFVYSSDEDAEHVGGIGDAETGELVEQKESSGA